MTCTEEYREHIEYTFHAFCKVVIRNATINAARTRSRKQEMIYLFFVKRIPQHEIGRQYGRSRSTAGYHIRKTLRQLQE